MQESVWDRLLRLRGARRAPPPSEIVYGRRDGERWAVVTVQGTGRRSTTFIHMLRDRVHRNVADHLLVLVDTEEDFAPQVYCTADNRSWIHVIGAQTVWENLTTVLPRVELLLPSEHADVDIGDPTNLYSLDAAMREKLPTMAAADPLAVVLDARPGDVILYEEPDETVGLRVALRVVAPVPVKSRIDSLVFVRLHDEPEDENDDAEDEDVDVDELADGVAALGIDVVDDDNDDFDAFAELDEAANQWRDDDDIVGAFAGMDLGMEVGAANDDDDDDS